MCTNNWRISLSGKIIGSGTDLMSYILNRVLLHIGWRLSSSISRNGWTVLILDDSNLLFIEKHK